MIPISGNYPDVPGPRIAYDRDGTQLYVMNQGTVTAIASANVKALNNESDDAFNSGDGAGGSNPGAYYIIFMFPQLTDLVGYHCNLSMGSYTTFSAIETSTDTTNGMDGTWTAVASPVTVSEAAAPGYRTHITAQSIPGIKAIRFSATTGSGGFGGAHWKSIHLYGKPSAAGDRLSFWHPTLDQPLSDFPAYLDWGNRPRSTSQTIQVRVKNRSTTLTASSITVGMDALTDASSPTYVSQHLFSYQGSGYASTISIPSLAPGAVSDVVSVQQTLLDTAALGLWAQRLYATAGSWA